MINRAKSTHNNLKIRTGLIIIAQYRNKKTNYKQKKMILRGLFVNILLAEIIVVILLF